MHEVTEANEAIRQIRDKFDANIRSGKFYGKSICKGKLKIEYTESFLVDIRQSLVQCDQQKNKILREVDRVMNELIQTLKDRKNEVQVIVDEYFKQEREKILAEEQKWRERQKICEELLRLSSKKDSDLEILSKSKYIADGIAQLNEKSRFNDLTLISSVDSIMHFKDDTGKQVDVTSTELVQLF